MRFFKFSYFLFLQKFASSGVFRRRKRNEIEHEPGRLGRECCRHGSPTLGGCFERKLGPDEQRTCGFKSSVLGALYWPRQSQSHRDLEQNQILTFKVPFVPLSAPTLTKKSTKCLQSMIQLKYSPSCLKWALSISSLEWPQKSKSYLRCNYELLNFHRTY